MIRPSAANRSPSPDLPAPVALTPGTLATRLSEVFRGALEHALRSCSYENFAKCFPTPASQKPDVLRSVWEQIVGKILAKADDEYEKILVERNVVEGLNSLERLLGEARTRKEEANGKTAPVAPHTVPARDLYLAHVFAQLEPVQQSLEAQLQLLRQRNAQLATELRDQKQEMEATLTNLEHTLNDVEQANLSLEETLGDRIPGNK